MKCKRDQVPTWKYQYLGDLLMWIKEIRSVRPKTGYSMDCNKIFTCQLIFISRSVRRGHPWYSGRALDYWTTGRAINPSPGAWFITKFIPLTQVVPDPSLKNAESWPEAFIYLISLSVVIKWSLKHLPIFLINDDTFQPYHVTLVHAWTPALARMIRLHLPVSAQMVLLVIRVRQVSDIYRGGKHSCANS